MEWKTGRKPKMGKISRKIDNGPRSDMGKNGPKKGGKNRKVTPNPIFPPFLGHFFPVSDRGPFSIFRLAFSHFRLSAKFFHSIPGGLTSTVDTQHLKSPKLGCMPKGSYGNTAF